MRWRNLRQNNADITRNDLEIARILLSTNGRISETDKARLEVLTGQVTQAQRDAEIHQLTSALLSGSILPAEKQRLEILTGQADKEQQINDLIRQQNSLYDAARAASPQEVAAHMTDFGGVALPQYTESMLQGLSSDVLQKVVQNMQASIAQLEAGRYTSASTGAEIASNFFYRDSAESILRTNINRAQQILGQRATFASTDRATALANYQGDPVNFDQIYNAALSSAANTGSGGTDISRVAQGLRDLNARLNNAGFSLTSNPIT